MKYLREIVAGEIPGIEQLIDAVEQSLCKRELYAKVQGEIFRDEDRSVIRHRLLDCTLFIKVWWAAGVTRFAQDCYRGGKVAVREAYGLLTIQQSGLATPRLIAYGQNMQSLFRGMSYIVTEEIPSAETLARYLSRETDLTVVRKTGRLLSHLHSQNIVHGDLHPENILISRDSPDDLFFVDCLEVRKKILARRKVAELVNFTFYAREKWPDKLELLDGILSSYCEGHPDGEKEFERLKGLIATGLRARERKIRRRG